MPRRIIARSEDVQLDLRQGPKTGERQRWMGWRMRQHHLSKPLRQLGARGVWVPKPPPNSQGAIVTWWTANAHTTGMHTNDVRQGKGLEGTDAERFDRDGPVDRQAFILRARQDGHQRRSMISLDAEDRADWCRFLPRVMAPCEADVGTRVDWLGAVHHDTARVRAPVVMRGGLPDGQPLDRTPHEWTYGFMYRAQPLATAMLGPTPGLSARAVQAVRA
jgi:hypothetical protein